MGKVPLLSPYVGSPWSYALVNYRRLSDLHIAAKHAAIDNVEIRARNMSPKYSDFPSWKVRYGFIEPMHRNKPNITYLLSQLKARNIKKHRFAATNLHFLLSN